MGILRENIFRLNNGVKTIFPERFNNEIFSSYGKTKKDSNPVRYKSNFSIKYVFNGTEEYFINDSRKKITSGKVLIVNNDSDSFFNCADAEALSIFINPQIFSECISVMNIDDNYLEEPFSNTNEPILFFDSVQNIDSSLKKVFDNIIRKKDCVLTIDFFYELAEQILISQNKLQRKINRISSKKVTTRRETYRRLEIGKEYIDCNLTKPFDLEMISKVSCLSKYHFIRLFKEVYDLTPNRYYIDKKLRKVFSLLKTEKFDSNFNEIVIDFGFSNYSLFFKQFKQIYGVSPSQFKELLRHAN